MESIYYVISWICHRSCTHCYEERFHPYSGTELESVLSQSLTAFPRIVENLPERMTYLDRRSPLEGGGFAERPGSIVLSGGEVLVKPVRETILYPVLARLRAKYAGAGGVKLIVQTTGDLLTDRIVGELLDLGVWMITVSGLDEYHQGLEAPATRRALQDKLTGMFESHGMSLSEPLARDCREAPDHGAYYHFFGATPETWIGRLWPRGRAFANELSTATLEDNFCNRWSGGLDFLQYRHSGSEVSIEPDGNVYPCCLKTKLPLGDLTRERLEDILERLQGNPVYEAISMGHPERMGITRGWTVDTFLEKSRVTLPSGRVYQNLCLGCDRFHDEVLSADREAGRKS